MAYHHINQSSTRTPGDPPPTSPFSIHAPAPTDIWRKPPNHDVFTAPITYQTLPVRSFSRARATATGDWATQYDQGGLVLVLPPPLSTPSGTQKRWVKCGIEYYNGAPWMSVVAAGEWADWSLVPLGVADRAAGRMTVEVERERAPADGSFGSVLKVYLLGGGEGEERMVIREVTWAFHDLDEEAEMWVGVFAAKPTRDAREELVVRIENFEVERRE